MHFRSIVSFQMKAKSLFVFIFGFLFCFSKRKKVCQITALFVFV